MTPAEKCRYNLFNAIYDVPNVSELLAYMQRHSIKNPELMGVLVKYINAVMGVEINTDLYKGIIIAHYQEFLKTATSANITLFNPPSLTVKGQSPTSKAEEIKAPAEAVSSPKVTDLDSTFDTLENMKIDEEKYKTLAETKLTEFLNKNCNLLISYQKITFVFHKFTYQDIQKYAAKLATIGIVVEVTPPESRMGGLFESDAVMRFAGSCGDIVTKFNSIHSPAPTTPELK